MSENTVKQITQVLDKAGFTVSFRQTNLCPQFISLKSIHQIEKLGNTMKMEKYEGIYKKKIHV